MMAPDDGAYPEVVEAIEELFDNGYTEENIMEGFLQVFRKRLSRENRFLHMKPPHLSADHEGCIIPELEHR